MAEFEKVIFQSPIGKLLIVTRDRDLIEVKFPESLTDTESKLSSAPKSETTKQVIRQLQEYFSGDRKEFQLRLRPEGTEFQKEVWEQLKLIQFGDVCCYGDVAKKIGKPKASRAVGAANGKNPIPIIIPCHRVVGKDGKLTGFGGGLTAKVQLLEHENSFKGKTKGNFTAETKIR